MKANAFDERVTRDVLAALALDRFILWLRRESDQSIRIHAFGPTKEVSETGTVPQLDTFDESAGFDAFSRARLQGLALYGVIFQPRVRSLYEECCQAVGGRVLPIHILVDDPELALLPWELLRDPDSDRFLARIEGVQFSRIALLAEQTALPRGHVKLRAGPLRVGVVSTADTKREAVVAETTSIDPAVTIEKATPDVPVVGRIHVIRSLLPGPLQASVVQDARLAVIEGSIPEAIDALAHVQSAIAIPPRMSPSARNLFLTRLYSALAMGETVASAVAAARRSLAGADSPIDLEWALPVLLTQGVPAAIIRPAHGRSRAHELVRKQTVNWVRDTATGVVGSVVVFLFGLLLFQVGFSSTSELSFDILSPWSLYTSFKNLVIEMSTFNEYFLLILGLLVALLAGLVFTLWVRSLGRAPKDQSWWIRHLPRRVTDLRAVSFLTISALTIFGAYVYQQYLWNVLLPIESDDFGIAITREVAAASFRDELADALFQQGQSRDVVVRELPVRFNANDVDEARRMGKRIGAEVVIIYRAADEGDRVSDSAPKHVAYIIFTDPTIGLSVGSEPDAANDIDSAVDNTPVIQLKQGIDVPVLRTETLVELINASAGIIAYHEDRSREAIEHLQLARPANPDAANTGLIDFYLANALSLDFQNAAATEAFEAAASHYERRRTAGEQLGPQDSLILVKTYYGRGRLATYDDDPALAVSWYERALALRGPLLARANDLERPDDLHVSYARLYAEMADAYRYLGDLAEAEHWSGRSAEEIAAIGASADDPRSLVERSVVSFYTGDCVGALGDLEHALTIEPDDVDALFVSGIIAYAQGYSDISRQHLERVVALKPDDIGARQQLALLFALQTFGDGTFLNADALDSAEEMNRSIVALDPTNLAAHDNLARIAWYRWQAAQFDVTAYLSSDPISVGKSQYLWSDDPERRRAALAASEMAIAERRLLALELRPGDVASQLTLTELYVERARWLFLHASKESQRGNSLEALQDGPQLLADVGEVRQWTGEILASEASHSLAHRLEAWSLRLQALHLEWSWYALIASDANRAETVEDEYRAQAERAMALAESVRAEDPEEGFAASQIFVAAAQMAFSLDLDIEAHDDAMARSEELQKRSVAATVASVDHFSTTCGEVRETNIGNERLVSGQYANAMTRFETALAINPSYAPAYRGLADSRYLLSDREGAVVAAQQASELAPSDARTWAALGFYQIANNEDPSATYDRFLAATASMASQERMALLRETLQSLYRLAIDDPSRAERIRDSTAQLTSGLAALDAASRSTYQCSYLYSLAGATMLLTGDPVAAARLLGDAIDLDPHHPLAELYLALASIAQGRDAAAEIEAFVAELRDPIWQSSPIAGPFNLLNWAEESVQIYVRLVPDHQALVDPLLSIIRAERGRGGV